MNPAFRTIGILKPLGWLYGGIMSVRNRWYDCGRLECHAFPLPVISIGNITVGGTGKTPHTEYIVSLLKDSFRLAVLSRGYGRSTRGFIKSDAASDSNMIGDEPTQIRRHFPDITVAVCEDRAEGIRKLDGHEAIVLDDAFQHRKVKPSLNILLVNWKRNILYDCVLPAGRMRENASGRIRADIIIVTKCPAQLPESEMEALAGQLAVRNDQKVFFSAMQGGDIYPFMESVQVPSFQGRPLLGVTGIASPAPMQSDMERLSDKVEMMSFPDHHRYSNHDISGILQKLESMGPDAVVLTTEKDAARLYSMQLPIGLAERIFIMPVSVRFLKDGDAFDRAVTDHVKSFNKQNHV
ncbi:MAG: tetraacyldisaccharide 4'-kinase [Bacteroidetes bacterium]|nr:tetraacyldisaccharide 4'-kinase [Candidatus Colenecus caballi]